MNAACILNIQLLSLQEENDEMMAVAVDPSNNTIPYEFFINQLMVIGGLLYTEQYFNVLNLILQID